MQYAYSVICTIVRRCQNMRRLKSVNCEKKFYLYNSDCRVNSRSSLVKCFTWLTKATVTIRSLQAFTLSYQTFFVIITRDVLSYSMFVWNSTNNVDFPIRISMIVKKKITVILQKILAYYFKTSTRYIKLQWMTPYASCFSISKLSFY